MSIEGTKEIYILYIRRILEQSCVVYGMGLLGVGYPSTPRMAVNWPEMDQVRFVLAIIWLVDKFWVVNR